MPNKKKGYGALLQGATTVRPDNNDAFLGLEDQAGPSNVVDTSDTLIDLEDMAHGTDNHGIPFILVDGAAYTTRSGLDLALSRVEQRRMEQVLKDIDSSDLLHLEDTEPPPELHNDINLSSKALAERQAAQQDRRHQQDISNLTFWPLEADASTTPTSRMDNSYTIEQVIQKLEQLRGFSKQAPPPDKEAPVAKVPMRPGIQREGTFDIKRKNEGDKDSDLDLEAASSKKSQTLKTPCRSGIPSLTGPKHPEKNYSAARARQLANHIGDLLAEYHTLNQEEAHIKLNEGSPCSYLVTICPANGASNCSVVPVPNPKFNNIRFSQIQSSPNIISYPKRKKPELNSRVIGRNSTTPAPLKQASPVTYSNERGRSQYLQKTPSSFINIPSPPRYYQGRKRD